MLEGLCAHLPGISHQVGPQKQCIKPSSTTLVVPRSHRDYFPGVKEFSVVSDNLCLVNCRQALARPLTDGSGSCESGV